LSENRHLVPLYSGYIFWISLHIVCQVYQFEFFQQSQFKQKEKEMILAEATMIQALAFVVEMTPIGTNLGLLHLLWTMVNGSFMKSRGAIFPALAQNGLSDEEMRRSWSAFRDGSWKISDLLGSWHLLVAQEGNWQERRYAGLRVVSVDTTGFWRPHLQGWAGKHYNSIAGKALPAVVVGVMVTSGQIRGRRIPLLQAIVRCQPEMDEVRFRVKLLQEASARPQHDSEVTVMDAGFELSEIHEAKLTHFVLRAASNCTARRHQLPPSKGRGRPSEYGLKVRPLARKYKDNKIPATQPDQTSEFVYEGRTIQVHSWFKLVTNKTKVSEDALTFAIHVHFDPAYKKPLVLVTDLDISAEDTYLIYKDRWPVEQAPLAAKQMIGLHRQFVFANQACFRLPELALLAGNILTYVAAVLPPIPTGFWDRHPQPTPGRLRRLLGQSVFPNLADFTPDIRKKNSVSDHLPKGVDAHRRQPCSS
jgi:hypothetical protein